VTRSATVDVIVDLRPESATYLRHAAFELTSENRRALHVPERFDGSHVLTSDTETTYLMDEFYAPRSEGGLRYNDPRLAIRWRLAVADLFANDAAWPLLSESDQHLREVMRVHAGESA
jgi:dTDP-4-dehydrorhamnose 3,5-epimerase